MFRYVKSGCIPTKETLIALAISLEMNIDEIQTLLQKAGYILSKSIAFDMVVKWLIKHDERKRKEQSLIIYINYVLDELELPLLMTREKES